MVKINKMLITGGGSIAFLGGFNIFKFYRNIIIPNDNDSKMFSQQFYVKEMRESTNQTEHTRKLIEDTSSNLLDMAKTELEELDHRIRVGQGDIASIIKELKENTDEMKRLKNLISKKEQETISFLSNNSEQENQFSVSTSPENNAPIERIKRRQNHEKQTDEELFRYNVRNHAIWKGEGTNHSNNTIYDTIEIVIAYCHADLDWIKHGLFDQILRSSNIRDDLKFKINILSKCGKEKELSNMKLEDDERVKEYNVFPIRNTGGCDYAYSYFINEYIKNKSQKDDAASSILLFIKDTSWRRYKPMHDIMRVAFTGNFACGGKEACSDSPHHDTGTLLRFTWSDNEGYVRKTDREGGNPNNETVSDFNLHEYNNLADFHHKALNWTFPNQNLTQVCYGGVFAVPASRVMELSNDPQTKNVIGLLKHSLERNTTSTVSIEEHFIERTWAGILAYPLNEKETEKVRKIGELGVRYYNPGAHGMLHSHAKNVCIDRIKRQWGDKVFTN